MNDPLPEIIGRLGCPAAARSCRDEPDIVELHQQGHPGATGSLAQAVASPRVVLRYDEDVDVVTFNDKEEDYDLRIRLIVAGHDLWVSITDDGAEDGRLRIGDSDYPTVIRKLAGRRTPIGRRIRRLDLGRAFRPRRYASYGRRVSRWTLVGGRLVKLARVPGRVWEQLREERPVPRVIMVRGSPNMTVRSSLSLRRANWRLSA